MRVWDGEKGKTKKYREKEIKEKWKGITKKRTKESDMRKRKRIKR